MQPWTYVFLLISFFGNLIGEVHCAVRNLRQVLHHGPVRIACLGDSITQGQPVVESETYPATLQSVLGNGYLVHNFGEGFTTVNRKDKLPTGHEIQPYEATVSFSAVLNWKPNIVLVMLGTNDARGASVPGDAFLSAYASLVAKLNAMMPAPIIYLCMPPPAYIMTKHYPGGMAINPKLVNEQLPSLVLSAAIQNNIPEPLNIFNDFLGWCPDLQQTCDLMTDGVHPSAQGYRRIATVIGLALAPPTTAPVGLSGKKWVARNARPSK